MDDQTGLTKERRSNGAVFAFISLGFVIHAAVICIIGIGWMHINELKATIKTFEQGCGCGKLTNRDKREVISSQAAPNLQSMLLLQFQDKLSNLEQQYQAGDSNLRREFTSKITDVHKQLGDINSEIDQYHNKNSDITCPGGYRLNPFRGTCVRFVRTQLSWSGAKFTCENSGEHLATFDTVESASWYRNQQVTRGWGGNSWIGGRKMSPSGEYRWYGLNTGPLTMSYWAVGQPDANGDCLISWQNHHYYWGDHDCDYKASFLCEMSNV